MIYDLHCHSDCSDGALRPAELVARAQACGVQVLALTDHDTIAGIAAARQSASTVVLVTGVEVSCHWQGQEIHIVGLHVDADHGELQSLLAAQTQRRWQRAEAIAAKLERDGVADALDLLRERFPNSLPSRSHFAQLLVALGKAKDHERAFQRYIGRKGSSYVAAQWPPLPEVVAILNRSQGLTVLAHPGRYQLSGGKLALLVREFAAAGGTALELSYPQLFLKEAQRMARMARELGLYASQGSDFHSPDQRWTNLGRMPPLPPEVTPIWQSPLWLAHMAVAA